MRLERQLAQQRRRRAQRVLDETFPGVFSIVSGESEVRVFAGRRLLFGLVAEHEVESADVVYGWACWISAGGHQNALEVE